MPRRPVAQFPRGPGRQIKRVATEALLITCPRLSPEWELDALRALMKPQARNRIEHLRGDQRWTDDDQRVVEATVSNFAARMGLIVETHFPDQGDFHVVLQAPADAHDVSLGLVWVLSRNRPGVWWTMDRLRVRDGIFYRRRRGLKLELVVATNIHLRRGMRTTLRRLVKNDGASV